MTPKAIRKYFDGLVARLGQAVGVEFVKFPGSHPHQCHKNVDAYSPFIISTGRSAVGW